MGDGGWCGLAVGGILIRVRGLCAAGFIMQFLIFERGVLGGRWPMVDGGWEPSYRSWSMVDGRWSMAKAGRFAGRILIKGRWFCAVGFIMQLLMLELGAEELQGAAEVGAEAGLVAVEALEAA